MIRKPRTEQRRGSAAPLIAVCLIPLIGVVAIVVDGGMLLSDRRQVQRAADSAALAAATDMFTNWYTNHGTDPNGSARQSALVTAAANGFPNDGVNSTVEVYISPQNYQGGPHKGTPLPPGSAQVLITYNQTRFFSSIWGSDALKVGAQAVARSSYQPAAPGILVLDPKSNNTLNVTCSGNVTVTGGGAIDVDSKSPNGGATCTNTGNVVADTINLSDGVYNHSNTGTLIGQVNYYVPPTPDPLASLPEPTQPPLPTLPASVLALLGSSYSTNNGVNYSGDQTIDLYPGYYGGISLTGSGSVVLHSNPDGSPGIYYLGQHGLSISNAGSITGSNVMIYNNGTGNISLTGSGSVSLSPPTSGIYQGITLFQERSSNKQISITAQGNMNMSGTFYAAAAKVSITGQGGYDNNIGSQWIAWQLYVTGSGSFTVKYNGQATPVRIIQLVE
jgi:Putative Flp pilus-assembly TadE/G-like